MKGKVKRQGLSLLSFVAVVACLVASSSKLGWRLEDNNRTVMITIYVISAVEALVSAIMYFGSTDDKLWKTAATLFVVVFLGMLAAPVFCVSPVVVALTFVRTVALFAMLTGVLLLLGLILFVLTET
ncbi:MAG: hypothetical protein K6G36_01250 [Candidatus Saccharibacteria bacterium]|nr:hypothetical protein [Candidatus Saccharibacteria bacterium]